MYNVNVVIVVVDVIDFDFIIVVVEFVWGEFGVIDILINNVGIGKFGGFMELILEEWINIIDVNVKGVYYMICVVLLEMMECNIGDIINIFFIVG